MEYGLIGEKLTHSFSKEIHARLADYDYRLIEVKREEIGDFLLKRDFRGINVTIPYKQTVIGYLDHIDDAAAGIGAVNTIVNDNGKLCGYNTDAFGLAAAFDKNGVDLSGKKVLILGGGGTSKTAEYVAKKAGAGCVLRVSRTEKPGFITYNEAKSRHNDAHIIINATPVGMFPDIDKTPIELECFKNLEAVADAVYNPINSRLVLKARAAGITAFGGLFMLCMQAYMAARYFTGEDKDAGKPEKIYSDILNSKRNIVLIGMPSAGKTSIGKMIARQLDMPFFDSDGQVTAVTGKTPAELILSEGEAAFREIESKVILNLSAENHAVIATGGGAVLSDENVLNLRANGKIYYIDRPLDLLAPSPGRPLSSSGEAMKALYKARRRVYESAADVTVPNNADIDFAADTIRKDFLL